MAGDNPISRWLDNLANRIDEFILETHTAIQTYDPKSPLECWSCKEPYPCKPVIDAAQRIEGR